jgi:hypothetical protein
MLLRDSVAQVRWSAACALGRLPQVATTIVTRTLCYAALHDPDPTVRSQCALILAQGYGSPQVKETPPFVVTPAIQSPMEITTILMLSANPRGTDALRLDQERRDIEEGLRRSSQRDRFRLETRVAVRAVDVRRAMLDYGPTIVHFSGHGAGAAGLVLEDVSGNPALVSGEALAGLFELFADRLQCVVLNACYTEVQAQAISRVVPFVVGMKETIKDDAALAFVVAFYDALGAGREVEFAFKVGCSEISMVGSSQKDVPVLLKKPQGVTMPMSSPKNCKIFILTSDSQQDLKDTDQLISYLQPLTLEGNVIIQSRKNIRAGDNKQKKLEEFTENADLILFLVSPDLINFYIKSRKIFDLAKVRSDSGKACIIPVLSRKTRYENTNFGSLNTLPSNGKFIDEFKKRADAFYDIANKISEILQSKLDQV